MSAVKVASYGRDHELWFGDSLTPPAPEGARLTRRVDALLQMLADLAAVEGPAHELAAGSAFRDARLAHHLAAAGGDDQDVSALVDLGDAFTSSRHAWQAWGAIDHQTEEKAA